MNATLMMISSRIVVKGAIEIEKVMGILLAVRASQVEYQHIARAIIRAKLMPGHHPALMVQITQMMMRVLAPDNKELKAISIQLSITKKKLVRLLKLSISSKGTTLQQRRR